LDYTKQDLDILRPLAAAYAAEALDSRARVIEKSYRDLNALKPVRPPVLVFEVPWGELDTQDELVLRCEGKRARDLERHLRQFLYQCKYFRGDYIAPAYFEIPKSFTATPLGIEIQEEIIHSTTGSDIQSHIYADALADEEALEKVNIPQYSLNEEETAAQEDFVRRVFDGLMPSKRVGHQLYLASWDRIPRYHGVDNVLYDLYDRPEFMHACIEKFTQINESQIEQWERLGLLEGQLTYLHCTPALSYDLPVKEHYTARDVWCRAMAQIFAVVSPDMHEEFDLEYTQSLFDRCGLAYYGCCEPLHNKIDRLRRFPNLRRISITPWADPDIAADQMGSDYVFSCKPNPAFVAGVSFDPEPVREEVRRVMNACRRNNTPCEFVLKDISSVAGDVSRLTQWVQTVNEVIDEFE
jgi:hypothetical protein